MSEEATERRKLLQDFYRFHLPHVHLMSVFGDDWFALRAEEFARFFGTPTFLVAQTVIVTVWIWINMAGYTKFDVYPFILLNLAFSLQAAYAAPLILLAQTRQADRDKLHAEADAEHRESLSQMQLERAAEIKTLLDQNTTLTEKVDQLTAEIHTVVTRQPPAAA